MKWLPGLFLLMVGSPLWTGCSEKDETPQASLPETTAGFQSVGVERDYDGNVLKAVLPPGWVSEPVFGMREESFRVVGEEGLEGEVTVTRLPITGGSLADNVNRWRRQVSLAPLENSSSLPEREVGGWLGVEVSLVPTDPEGNAINGMIFERADTRWFIKFTAPASLWKFQETSWNRFLDSIEWKPEANQPPARP